MSGGQQPSHVLTNLTEVGQERSEGIGPSTTQVTQKPCTFASIYSTIHVQ